MLFDCLNCFSISSYELESFRGGYEGWVGGLLCCGVARIARPEVLQGLLLTWTRLSLGCGKRYAGLRALSLV